MLLDILYFAFKNRDLLLEKYSPYQLANGLEYLFNPSFAEFDFIFQSRDQELEKQVETILALGPLMIEIFEPNAEPVLGFMSMSVQDNQNKILNDPCYMFWDTAYIPWNCDKAIVTACVDIMGVCARSSNPAVVEGALHGLGHMVRMYGEDIDKMVEHYIDRANTSSSHYLRDYASKARMGRIFKPCNP